MLNAIPHFDPDPILALVDLFKNDPRENKLDLGIGVYQTDSGATPVLKAVKQAERYLVDTQESKTYLGSLGNRDFLAEVKRLVLGAELADRFADRLAGFQAVGGTGALRLAGELIRLTGNQTRLFVGLPTWPNHLKLFKDAGVQLVEYGYFDTEQHGLMMPSILEAAKSVSAGDFFLLHGCCHNPTGADLAADQRAELLAVLKDRGAIPLVDIAYAGFAEGLDQDLALTREVFDQFDEALLSFSCSKSFGLYRERVGALIGKGATADVAARITAALASIARGIYSMPPDHGAASVTTILQSDELKALWVEELDEMRGAINSRRTALAAHHNTCPALVDLGHERGMFSLLPISKEAVLELRDKHAIYMTGNARINVLGVREPRMKYFVDSLVDVVG